MIRRSYSEADALADSYLSIAEAQADAAVNGWGENLIFDVVPSARLVNGPLSTVYAATALKAQSKYTAQSHAGLSAPDAPSGRSKPAQAHAGPD